MNYSCGIGFENDHCYLLETNSINKHYGDILYFCFLSHELKFAALLLDAVVG